MVIPVLQLRRLAIATATAFVLAVGLGSISLGAVPCDDASGAGETVAFEAIAAVCDGEDCADHECCTTHPTADCCHSGGIAAIDAVASLHRPFGGWAWVPRQGAIPHGTGPGVGRHPPRL